LVAGELALNRVLTGTLPRPAFSEALRESAPRRWYAEAAFSLLYAEAHAARGDGTACAGAMARAALAAAQARLAERGEWALNEKGMLSRAELTGADEMLAARLERPSTLPDAVERLRRLLGLGRPSGMKLDQPVRLPVG
jgi:hypothetical protein